MRFLIKFDIIMDKTDGVVAEKQAMSCVTSTFLCILRD